MEQAFSKTSGVIRRSSEEGGRTSGGGTSSPVRSQNGIGVEDPESAGMDSESRSSSTSDSTLRSSESASSSSCKLLIKVSCLFNLTKQKMLHFNEHQRSRLKYPYSTFWTVWLITKI